MKIQLGLKTNGNFGGFPVGNDVLSNFGISLGNPYDVYTPIYYTPYTGITYSIYDTVASTAAAAVYGVPRS